eukprot:g3098.t1
MLKAIAEEEEAEKFGLFDVSALADDNDAEEIIFSAEPMTTMYKVAAISSENDVESSVMSRPSTSSSTVTDAGEMDVTEMREIEDKTENQESVEKEPLLKSLQTWKSAGCSYDYNGTLDCFAVGLSGPLQIIFPTDVQIINLKWNNITSIHSENFNRLANLELIWLNNNKLTSIEEGTFIDQKKLERIYVENNEISSIAPDAFKNLPSLQFLGLKGNPIDSKHTCPPELPLRGSSPIGVPSLRLSYPTCTTKACESLIVEGALSPCEGTSGQICIPDCAKPLFALGILRCGSSGVWIGDGECGIPDLEGEEMNGSGKAGDWLQLPPGVKRKRHSKKFIGDGKKKKAHEKLLLENGANDDEEVEEEEIELSDDDDDDDDDDRREEEVEDDDGENNNDTLEDEEWVFGSLIEWECEKGYNLIGDDHASCDEDGKWSGEPPKCIPVSCGDPNHPKNGSRTIVPYPHFEENSMDDDDDAFTYRSIVFFSCDFGYQISNRQRQGIRDRVASMLSGSISNASSQSGIYTEALCLETGKWSQPPPLCQPEKCGSLPVVENAKVVKTTGEEGEVGATILYECENGYEVVKGDLFRQCMINGWSGSSPICERVACDKLNLPPATDIIVMSHAECDGWIFDEYATVLRKQFLQLDVEKRGWIGLDSISKALTEADYALNSSMKSDNHVSIEKEEMKLSASEKKEEENRVKEERANFLDSIAAIIVKEADVNENNQISFNEWSVLLCKSVGKPNEAWTFSSLVYKRDDETVQKLMREWLTTLADGIVQRKAEEEVLREISEQGIENDVRASIRAKHGEDIAHQFVFEEKNQVLSENKKSHFGAIAIYECAIGYRHSSGNRIRKCESGMWTGETPLCINPCENGGVINPLLPWTWNNTMEELKQLGLDLQEEENEEDIAIDSNKEDENREEEPTPLCICRPGFYGPLCKRRQRCANFKPPNSLSTCVGVFGDTCKPKCKPCYTLQSKKKNSSKMEDELILTCSEKGRFIGPPVCRIRQCHFNPSDENVVVASSHGSLAVSSNRFTCGSTATFKCSEGFESVGGGDHERKCTETGWGGKKLECRPVQCRALPTHVKGKYGRFLLDSKNTGLGDDLIYKCDSGYFLPQCSQRLSKICNRVTRKCISNGQWSEPRVGPLTMIVEECEKITCGDPDGPDNGVAWSTHADVKKTYELKNMIREGTKGPRFPIGYSLDYICNHGYEMKGSSSRKCLYEGVWSGVKPTCHLIEKAKLCTMPNQIRNGSITVFDQEGHEISKNVQEEVELTEGSAVEFECHNGYVLVSAAFRKVKQSKAKKSRSQWDSYKKKQRTAMNQAHRRLRCVKGGKWTGQSPRCVAVECGAPPELENGNVTVLSASLHGKAKYKCHDCYTLNSACSSRILPEEISAVCVADGEWSVALSSSRPMRFNSINKSCFPRCIRRECKPPILPKYSYSLAEKRQSFSNAFYNRKDLGPIYFCGEEVRIVCDEGFGMRLEDGSFTFTKMEREESRASLPAARLLCEPNGDWTFQNLKDGTHNFHCEPITCKNVEIPKYCERIDEESDVDLIENELYPFGAILTHRCKEGYTKSNGSEKIQCGANGWSDSAPYCRAKKCLVPRAPKNGKVQYESRLYRSIAEYSCDEGYYMEPSPQQLGKEKYTRICDASGKWSGNLVPKCLPIVCQDPDVPEHGGLL